jgi:hypothetical protein
MIKESVDIFENIMKYMGDTGNGKELEKCIQLIATRGLKVPQLRDEIYCQLLKQTNGHPKM